ncbi:MAG: hypothetical protein KAF64_06685 [Hydrogenophaga sp.]|uniref:hypothetical protein n=1 Tax=Hydrogenophaga sp. TaxID=1904254 RepID=UPI0025B7DA94|nr:hypothetical protein [Hydrogenophaga sp.]MBU7573024.1 hypothetical protein [Hydrogenophaga sp.]
MNPIIKNALGSGLPGVGNAFVRVHVKPFAHLLFNETRRHPEGALTKTGHIAFQPNTTTHWRGSSGTKNSTSTLCEATSPSTEACSRPRTISDHQASFRTI